MTKVLPSPAVAVVTGASAGVGRAVAVAFGRRGWRVGLLARGQERLDSAACEVIEAGGEALVLPVDVADAGGVQAAADQVVAAWGSIDVWINNAMATIFAPVEAVTPEEFARVSQVTYLGQVHGTLAALRHMRPRDHGTIVQVGSALAYRSIPLQAAYCAAKAAVRGFTDSLRSELLHQGSGIRVKTVHLPAVNTPQFDWARSRLPRSLQPVPPIYQPEPIAKAIVGAAHEGPRELWIGKTTIQAILATGAAPGFMDGLMARRAWEGQMTQSEPDAQCTDNLFQPPPGDPDARGRFDARSRGEVFAPSGRMVRLGLTACGAGLMVGAVLLAAHWRERR